LEICESELLVLLGPSGCGKSTLLRLIAGLEELTEGEIYFGENRIDKKPPKDRHIAMVFQNYSLYPHMTVEKNLAFPLKIARFDKDEIKKRVEDVATMLGITDKNVSVLLWAGLLFVTHRYFYLMNLFQILMHPYAQK
jgi:multiple sugar transport system ATP-binding protein